MNTMKHRVERLETESGVSSFFDPNLPILMRAPSLETDDEALARYGLAFGTAANWIELVELEARQ